MEAGQTCRVAEIKLGIPNGGRTLEDFIISLIFTASIRIWFGELVVGTKSNFGKILG